jgi:hypothetical protein
LALSLSSWLLVPDVDARRPLRDAPVIWYDADKAPIPPPQEREPSPVWDQVDQSFLGPLDRSFRPSRVGRRIGKAFGGQITPRAHNVNELGEVPNSSWFENRIGLFPMSTDEVARGPGEGTGPDLSQPWTVVSAKTEGVTPGFNVRDAEGDVYVIKFDALENANMSSAAGVISARILHAAGYHVPDDVIVSFTRDRLVLGSDVELKLPDGSRRRMTEADLDAILAAVPHRDGRWRAISSRFLDGRPLGPFDFEGVREDDPNDRVPHQHRRELRGLATFASWIAHFDTKQHNTLDMYVGEDGQGHVRHHLIDFASTLGTGAFGPTWRVGFEYTFDPFPILGRILAVGIHEDAWRELERPLGGTLTEVGNYEAELFDPREWKPLMPNPAFVNQNHQDAYWAAKIIAAFGDDQIRAAVEQARYEDPRATDYMTETLIRRRDIVARAWFDVVTPLDFFRYQAGTLTFHDLGAEREIYPGTTPRYRVQVAAVTADRDAARWSEWMMASDLAIDLTGDAVREVVEAESSDARPFVAVRCDVDRGDGWQGPVTVYVARASGRVVAVDR